ncbi:BTB/POZ-like protein [Cordyceps javanica]|uniref:BTB/POZ-like protein n=1 Tax=Cordyceps javanica TaxID=43265 RepID=A0A545VSE9_9HYPO|nr:BTB/POZ-like protein [Cordyceps javanica]TQW04648.1 BTB/POZ-like protein [Cordyceps javanica]
MASWRNKEPRGPAKQWSRLKPVQMDPLEEMGLPSKGEKRLNGTKVQEQYYKLITERYLSFCSDAGERDELLRRFSSLGLGSDSRKEIETYSIVIPDTASAESLQTPSNTKSLSIIMSALRKLREGIVASKRTDDFAIQAYLFCIRLAVLVKHSDSYHVAILHLIRKIHPEHNLTPIEFQEVVAYLILDTACRRRELSEAYSLRQETGDETVLIKVKDEEFSAHKAVLSQHSGYFRASAKSYYDESAGEISFDNINPKYFALFLGVAYSYSSIIPHTMPAPAPNPEAQSQRTPMRDYVEVYKLCDRFICPTIATYILRYIHALIGDRHRALYRSALDKAQQLWCTKDFADAFEALEQNHAEQKKLGSLMIEYFCEGVYYRSWEAAAEELESRPAFVLRVSRYFASKLALLFEQRTKLKRKELKMPALGE